MESAQAEETKADVLVQVPVAAEGRFAVVQVERAQVLHSHYVVKILQRLFETRRFPQVVPCGVNVAGVQTDSDALLVVYEGNDIAQVFKHGADDVAAAGHGFENGRDGLSGCVGAVEGLGYAGDGGGAGLAARPARVEVVESDTEGFAAVEVVEEGVVGLGSL